MRPAVPTFSTSSGSPLPQSIRCCLLSNATGSSDARKASLVASGSWSTPPTCRACNQSEPLCKGTSDGHATDRWRGIREACGFKRTTYPLKACKVRLAALASLLFRGELAEIEWDDFAIHDKLSLTPSEAKMRRNRWTAQPFRDVRVADLDGTLQRLFRKLYRNLRATNVAAAPLSLCELLTLLNVVCGGHPSGR